MKIHISEFDSSSSTINAHGEGWVSSLQGDKQMFAGFCEGLWNLRIAREQQTRATLCRFLTRLQKGAAALPKKTRLKTESADSHTKFKKKKKNPTTPHQRSKNSNNSVEETSTHTEERRCDTFVMNGWIVKVEVHLIFPGSEAISWHVHGAVVSKRTSLSGDSTARRVCFRYKAEHATHRAQILCQKKETLHLLRDKLKASALVPVAFGMSAVLVVPLM